MSSQLVRTDSPRETRAVGESLARSLSSPLVIALVGDLGAGKTEFVKGFLTGIDGDPESVSSPTFVLIQEYAGRIPVLHFDTYRLESLAEFLDLGAEEMFYSDAICLVEWADRVESVLPAKHIRIEFSTIGENSRDLRIIDHR